jgi:hypothetical protein
VAIFDQDKEYIYLQQIKQWIIIGKLAKQISYEYRKRWNIETGYRAKEI